MAWVVDELLLLQKHVPRGDLWWEMGEGRVRKKTHLLGVLSTPPPSSDHRLSHGGAGHTRPSESLGNKSSYRLPQ